MSGPVYRYCIQKQACTEGVSQRKGGGGKQLSFYIRQSKGLCLNLYTETGAYREFFSKKGYLMILNLILVCLKQKDFLEEEGKPFCHHRQNTGFMPGPVYRNRRVQAGFLIMGGGWGGSSSLFIFVKTKVYVRICIRKQARTESFSQRKDTK